MNKSNISGWKDVFSFTFKQTMKSRAFMITFVILLLISAVSMPVVSLITSRNTVDENALSPVSKVYINNKTTLPDMDFSALHEEKAFSQLQFETLQEDYELVSSRIEENETSSVILTISNSDGMYNLAFVKASGGPVKDESLSLLGTAVAEEFDKIKIKALGISAEQAAMLQASVDTKVSMLDVNGAPVIKEDTSISGGEYGIMYGILFVIMMISSIAGGQIATSIVTEKSTRVIEYLLITVKPLALIVGKITAMLASVLIQVVSLLVVMFLSNKVSAAVTSGNGNDVISTYLPSNIFHNLNLINIIFCLIVFILGMIFYATLAGLAGATVSKLEEIQEGIQLFTFATIIGAYIGIAAANILLSAGDNGFITFAYLFPLSSPFILPGAILIGKAGAPMIAIAIACLLIFIILLFKFVAKVFETLILHNGNKIKIKELVRLSKN